MIKVLMLDLGHTLVDGNKTLPYVPEALSAFQGFRTESGQPLETCLVSDFHLVDLADENEIARRFDQYVTLLDDFGLRGFFEPVSRRVTLSTHVGLMKPHRKVYERALERLGSDADLSSCLFVTERDDHVEAARDLGMSGLIFGALGNGEPEFKDWATGLLLVAHQVCKHCADNLQPAFDVWLAGRKDLELLTLERIGTGGVFRATANELYRVSDPELGKMDGVFVPQPVQVELTLDQQGRVAECKVCSSNQSDREEASYLVRSLVSHHQVAEATDYPAPGVTHAVETDAKGRRILTRKRFSA